MYQEFGNNVRLAAPASSVWATILDFPRVASWLHIVSELKEVEAQKRYTAVIADKVGPFSLKADLTANVSVDAAARRLTATAEGEDRQIQSRITATLEIVIAEDGAGSVLDLKGRYEIAGKVATLGAGAIRKKGDKILEEFFATLARELGGAAPAA